MRITSTTHCLIFATAALVTVATGNAIAQVPQRTTATYADWTVRCIMHGKSKACEMAQTVQIKGRPEPISQIAFGHQTKNSPLKVVFEVPVDVWLPGGIELVTAKKQDNITANFDRCIPMGCFSESEINEAEIKSLSDMKKNGKLEFKNARKQEIAIPVSFKGFGDAYDALLK